jgi:hypothetical protein
MQRLMRRETQRRRKEAELKRVREEQVSEGSIKAQSSIKALLRLRAASSRGAGLLRLKALVRLD